MGLGMGMKREWAWPKHVAGAIQSNAKSLLRNTVKFGNNEIEGTEYLARYRRYSLLPTATVEEFS